MKLVQVLILVVAAFILVIGATVLLIIPGIPLTTMALFACIVMLAILILYFAAGKLDGLQPQQSPPISTSVPVSQGKHAIFQTTAHMQDMNKTLYIVESVWPFKFFPCKLMVEEGGITIMRTTFFKVASTETILIKDLFNIILNTGPVFASIDIQRRTSIEGTSQVLEVSYLPKQKALIAKQIIDGLLLESAGTVKIPKSLPTQARRAMLITAGRNKHVEKDVNA